MSSFSTSFVLFLAAIVVSLGVSSAAVAQSGSQGTQTRFAVLVGVDDYALNPDGTHSVTPLKGPRNDVALMKKLLIDSFGFKDDGREIVTLTGAQATHGAIRDAYKAMVTKAAASPNAVLLFYYSGHGSQIDDHDGDEGDGVDETLVAFDSRLPGKSDIIDDELAAWQADLRTRAPSSKITYIFDSCHSGTGIKGLSSSPLRQARYLAPASPLRSAAAAARSADLINAVLPEGRDYVLLAGSTAAQLSYEDVIDTGAPSPVVHGIFTWYLAQTLRQNPVTTNDALIRRIAGPIQSASGDQTPQAEGAIEEFVLSGTGESEDPSLPVIKLGSSNNTLELAAGATLGLRQGSLVAIYRPGTKRLVGDANKIGEASITSLGDTSSLASIIGIPKEPLSSDVRVALVTPYFGTGALKANVTQLPGQPTSANDRNVLTEVSRELLTHRFVAAAAPGEEWDIAINRGCTKDGRLYAMGETQPAGCIAAYYLRPRGSSIPLMGFSTAADGKPAASAETLAKSIELHATQKNVKAIENQRSNISGQIRLVLIKVLVVKGPDGRWSAEPQLPSPNRGITPLKVGESFLIRVENNSDYPLHMAVFNLASGGNTSLIGSASNGDLIAPHNQMVITRKPWTVGRPLGIESFKAIATTSSNVNFRVLDDQRLAARGPDVSPLEWLLASAVDAKARDSGPSSVDLSEWTTTQLDLQIVP